MKIGVVLAGGGSKGAYELGVLKALNEYFGIDSIRCVASASIGSLIAQTFGSGKLDVLVDAWKGFDQKRKTFILSCSGNEGILSKIDKVISGSKNLPFEHYVSIWNFTRRKIEFVPFHNLRGEKLKKYMRGAIAVPLFSRGEVVDGNRILDGAFLENIPVYPLVNKDLDFIFCVYFDNYKYMFENKDFDKKIIKLFDFPNTKRLGLMQYSSNTFDNMVTYGYDYTMRVVKELFDGRTNNDEIYDAIDKMEQTLSYEYKPRLTADVVLNNINVVTKKYAKRLSTRKKL